MSSNQPPRPFSPTTVLVLLASLVVLAVLPLLLIRDSEFGGTDAAAQQAISEIRPGLQPWAHPLFEPPGGETESLLFALQAAMGAGAIGYFFGVKRGQRMAVQAVASKAHSQDDHSPSA